LRGDAAPALPRSLAVAVLSAPLVALLLAVLVTAALATLGIAILFAGLALTVLVRLLVRIPMLVAILSLIALTLVAILVHLFLPFRHLRQASSACRWDENGACEARFRRDEHLPERLRPAREAGARVHRLFGAGTLRQPRSFRFIMQRPPVSPAGTVCPEPRNARCVVSPMAGDTGPEQGDQR
jgi:hypothetical protein